jgi:hypothetical protein
LHQTENSVGKVFYHFSRRSSRSIGSSSARAMHLPPLRLGARVLSSFRVWAQRRANVPVHVSAAAAFAGIRLICNPVAEGALGAAFAVVGDDSTPPGAPHEGQWS